jgi:hypothetical protein
MNDGCISASPCTSSKRGADFKAALVPLASHLQHFSVDRQPIKNKQHAVKQSQASEDSSVRVSHICFFDDPAPHSRRLRHSNPALPLSQPFPLSLISFHIISYHSIHLRLSLTSQAGLEHWSSHLGRGQVVGLAQDQEQEVSSHNGAQFAFGATQVV